MRLLAVHAHPDDETLATGGLLASWAGAGLPAAVVTCTRGEQGEVIGERHAALEGDGPALAAHRETELAAALAALGVTEHHFLDRLPAPGAVRARYADSGMSWADGTYGTAAEAEDVPDGAFVRAPLDEAAGRLAGLLKDLRPAVVATYDPRGGYGHPDHVRAHEVTMRARELAAPSGVRPVVLWRSTHPEELRAERRALAGAAWVETLRSAAAGAGARVTLPEPDGALPPVASADRPVAVAVDVVPVLGRVLGALRAHATQVQEVTAAPDGDRLAGCYALSNDVLVPLGRTETYAVAPGSAPAASVDWPSGVRRVA